MENQSPIDLNSLVTQVADVAAESRARVVELRAALAGSTEVLAGFEQSFTALQTQNEALKNQIYNGGPSPEFKALLEAEQTAIRAQISQTRATIDQLADLHQKFESQLLSLVDLDKSITETLVGLK